MIDPAEITKMLQQHYPDCRFEVTGDGSHFQVIAIDEMFNDMGTLNRQRTINKVLNDRIVSGEIHAIEIKAYTDDEWQAANKLNISTE